MAQRLGQRFLGRPPLGLWACPWYLSSLCLPSPSFCSAVGLLTGLAAQRTDGIGERIGPMVLSLPGRSTEAATERAGRVGLPRSSADGCQPTATQRRRASTISGGAGNVTEAVAIGALAFVGEIGGKAKYQLSQYLSVRGGYRRHGTSGR